MVKRFKALFTIFFILFSITAGWAADFTWTGIQSTDWDDYRNWKKDGVAAGSGEVPGVSPNTDAVVVINSGGNQPVIENKIVSATEITKTVQIKKLTIVSLAKLTLILKQQNIELISTDGISVTGEIIFDLKEGNQRYVKISNTDFTGSSNIFIDSPLAPLVNSAYHTKLQASGSIHFKQGSSIKADNYANDDKFIINSPKTTIAGSFTVDSKLEIQNSFGTDLALDITGTLTAKKDFTVTDHTNTIIRSSVEQSDGTVLGGTVDLTENLTLNNASWSTSKGEVKTKGNFDVPYFMQTGGILKLEGTSVRKLKINQVHNLTFSNNVNLDGDLKISGAFTANGDFDAGSRSVTFNGISQISGNAASNIVFNDLIVSGSKALTVTKDITIKKGLTNNGTFSANGKIITLDPSGTTVTITGTSTADDTTFGTLSLMSATGKTLEIGGKITVDNLDISGTSASKLTVQGSSPSDFNIKLTSDQIPNPTSKKGYYLDVKSSIPITDNTYYIALSTLPASNPPANWRKMSSTWNTGATTEDWNTTANWTPAAVPTADWPVIIPAGSSGAKYPKLNPTTSSNPAAKASSVPVEAGAELDLGAEIIQDNGAGSAVTTHITNNGTLKMIGTATGNPGSPGQKEWLSLPNNISNVNNITHGNNSTIEYYSGTNNNVWAGPYKNLSLNDRLNLKTNNEDLTVNGTLTVRNRNTHINTGSGSTGGIQRYKGAIDAGDGTTFSYCNIEFTAKSLTTEPPSGSHALNINAGSITVNAGEWTSDANINAAAVTVSGTGSWTSKRGYIELRGNLSTPEFIQTGGTLTFNGNTTPQTLTFTSTSPTAQKNINNLTINTGATVKLASDITIAGDFTNNGSFDATNTGSPPGYTVTLTHDANHTITGTNNAGNTKFHTLSLTGAGGKELTIDGKITVNDGLTLTGTGDTQLLTVQGGTNASEITLNGHKTGGKWLKVNTNIPIANGGSYIAAASKPDPANNPPQNWIFTNDSGQVVWKGTYSDAWNVQGNWEPPYATPSEHVDVIIESGQDGRYPHVGQYSGAKAKSVTVKSGAKLDLGEWTIQTSGSSTAKLNVKSGGHLFLKGSNVQKAWFNTALPENKITVESGSTVEYNGNPTSAANVWEGPYHKLIVSGDKTKLEAGTITVEDTFTVQTTGALTVKAGNQTYKGAVTLNADTTFEVIGWAEFKQNASITGLNSIFTVRGNLKPECPSVKVKKISVSGMTETNSASSPTDKIEVFAGEQTYEGAVTLKKNSVFTAPRGTITFKKHVTSVDGSNKKDLEIQAGSGTVSFGEKPSVSPPPPLHAVTVNNLTLSAGNVFSYSEINASNAVQFTVNDSGSCVIRGPVKTGSFEQKNSGCNLQIGASVKDTGGSPLAAAVFNVESKRIYITDNADIDPSSSIVWTRPADASFFIAKDINLANSLSCANFVLFAGTVTMSGTGITAEAASVKGDIVLFGQNCSPADTASGVSELFTYNNIYRRATGSPGMTAEPSVVLPSKLPDGTALPGGLPGGKYSGSFADLSGKTLKAGKNFYANGMTLTPAAAWTLDIPNNYNATAAFAEAYFTTVANCTVNTGGSLSTNAFVAAAEDCTVDANSPAWKTDRPLIAEAYTVSDDTIYVKFNKKIENSNNEINKAVQHIKFSSNRYGFTKAYKDRGCTISTDGQGDLSEFYLRVETDVQRWNTDATGTSAGDTDSTCRGGKDYSPSSTDQNRIPRHWSNTVDLTIPKALNTLYASLRDEHKNRIKHYSGTNKFTATADRCPPVLAAVYTGQEQHVEGGSQAKYDAHNFIEFRYSEPVFIGSGASAIPNSAENLRAENIGLISNLSPGITVSGFASFAGGSIDVGNFASSAPADQNKVHALYRKFSTSAFTVPSASAPAEAAQSCRIRVSVAGYYDSTDKWIGYIKSAQTPSGTVAVLTDPRTEIRTRDSMTPALETWEKLDTNFTPHLYSTSDASDPLNAKRVSYHPLASSWDTSPPVFAKVSDDIGHWTNSGNKSKEIAAYSASSQFADKIEFHFFDNTPDYTSTALWWRTAAAAAGNPGWNDGSSSTGRYDSYGGSRFTGTNRTIGGIRACTLPLPGEVQNVFSFTPVNPEFSEALEKFKGTDSTFTLSLAQKAENEALFGPRPSGFSEQDSLYLQLKLTPTSVPLAFPVTETFTVAYQALDASHPNGGRITDLAGNLMKSFSDGASIDASPPNIALTAAPVGLKQIYILFTTQINTEPETLKKLPHNLEIIDVPSGSTIQIDPSIPARVRTDTKNGTGIIVSLTEPVTYNALSGAKIKVIKDGGYIHIRPKETGFPAFEGHKHVISDFALNIIRPLLAYDERKFDDGSSGFLSQGIYGGTSKAVRLFDGSGTLDNTVLDKEDIIIHLAVENVEPADTSAPTALQLYIDNSPLPGSVSVDFNKATNLGSRVWLPKITDLPSGAVSVLPALSSEANVCSANEDISLSPTAPGGFKYEFTLFNNPLSPNFLNYPDGSRAGFLFAMKNGGNYITIDHDCDGTGTNSTPKVPLYALRLKDPNDPASIDLWSLDIAAIRLQRGGVTVLNNVINTSVRENAVVQVQTEKAGSLSVLVMTLDGDVVKILHSGRVQPGEHRYQWNGTNKNGDAVARGMYFIRVIGPNIDETRKVMAVKE